MKIVSNPIHVSLGGNLRHFRVVSEIEMELDDREEFWLQFCGLRFIMATNSRKQVGQKSTASRGAGEKRNILVAKASF